MERTARAIPALAEGDAIAVVAPSGPVDEEALAAGIKRLETRFRVVWDRGLLDQDGYLAGSDERRLAELSYALSSPEIRAVFAARGGYGITRIIDRLDLAAFAAAPKWIVGCSDATALLATLWARFKIPTIHGPMMAGLGRASDAEVDCLIALLEGRAGAEVASLCGLRQGEAQGPLVGGNLTVLASCAGTLPKGFADGAIVLLEDVGERPYRLDRCVVQLRRSGVLCGMKGLVLGELTQCEKGRDGTSAQNAIVSCLEDLDVPMAAGFKAAHGESNTPFVHGGTVRLEVLGTKAFLHPVEF